MEKSLSNKYTSREIKELFSDDLKSHYIKRDLGVFPSNIRGSELDKSRDKYQERDYEIINRLENHEKKKREISNDEDEKQASFIDKWKYKFVLKVAGCIFMGMCICIYKRMPKENIKSSIVNNGINWIKSEYRKDYSRTQVIEKVENVSCMAYDKLGYVIPESLAVSVRNKYIENIKPKLMNLNFNLNMNQVSDIKSIAVYNEEEIVFEDLNSVSTSLCGSSELSLMELDKEEIVAKNISIALPVSGVVTSDYGAREEVFKNVGYHTGIDVANAYNTPISSATDGVVIQAQVLDKYYGNNIIIEKDGVRFRYAHLNQMNVNVGDNIKQGDIIGLMGSTGASTGSHLHFEIIINERTVNPELLLKFR